MKTVSKIKRVDCASEPKDIFVQGNLVIAFTSDQVVMVTGDGNERRNFSGTSLHPGSCLNERGDHDDIYAKEAFYQFTDKLILTVK